MVIILSVIGFILAIYLVLLLQGHLAKKKSLTALQIYFDFIKEREDKHLKYFEENCGKK
jgi:hypothetical protein